MHRHFSAEQWLPYPVETVFAFFANPENLPRLMPGWQKARIEEAAFRPPPPNANRMRGVRSVVAGDGTQLTLSFRPFPFAPVRVGWVAAISHFEWNRQFCDTQLRGPFAFWHHCHKVAATDREGSSGTLLRDEVEYELPLDPLSRLALPVINQQFEAMFAFRHKRTSELMALFANRPAVL